MFYKSPFFLTIIALNRSFKASLDTECKIWLCSLGIKSILNITYFFCMHFFQIVLVKGGRLLDFTICNFSLPYNVSGLASDYRHKHETRRVCGLLWGLSYLPHGMIANAFRQVIAANNNRRYNGLYRYFEATWLNDQFEPKFRSVYREGIRTNNSIEGIPHNYHNIHESLKRSTFCPP